MTSTLPSKELDSKSREFRASSNSNKLLSLVRFAPNCSIHHRKIGISNSKVLFFYLSKPLQIAKPRNKKIIRTIKPNDLPSTSIKSSTTPRIKKSSHANKYLGIVEGVSIASSNAKV